MNIDLLRKEHEELIIKQCKAKATLLKAFNEYNDISFEKNKKEVEYNVALKLKEYNSFIKKGDDICSLAQNI
jgi:hypothetical protein